MVIRLDDDTLDSFLPLIPEEIQDYAEEDNVYCFGSVRDETAVGVLVFSLGDGVSRDGDPKVMVMLYWICTAEDYRRQGVADELMKALLDVTGDSGETVIVCSIPLNEDPGEATAFFRNRGFEFDANDIPIMEISKEDCRQSVKGTNKEKELIIAAEPERPEGLVSLNDISRVRFRKTVKSMLDNEDFSYYYNLTDAIDVYDRDTSYAIMKGSEISSIVLFRKTRRDELHMVMLDARINADPRELLELLHYAAARYYLDKPEEMRVRLILWKEKSRKLAEHIFPHKNVFMVRRGFLSVSPR